VGAEHEYDIKNCCLALVSKIQEAAFMYSAFMYSAFMYSAFMYSAFMYSAFMYSAFMYSAFMYSAFMYSAFMYSAFRFQIRVRGVNDNHGWLTLWLVYMIRSSITGD